MLAGRGRGPPGDVAGGDEASATEVPPVMSGGNGRVRSLIVLGRKGVQQRALYLVPPCSGRALGLALPAQRFRHAAREGGVTGAYGRNAGRVAQSAAYNDEDS